MSLKVPGLYLEGGGNGRVVGDGHLQGDLSPQDHIVSKVQQQWGSVPVWRGGAIERDGAKEQRHAKDSQTPSSKPFVLSLPVGIL